MPVSPANSAFCSRRALAQALCVLLLLASPAVPADAEDAKPLTAILLVARGELRDPNFADSVVLVMNHLGPAPVGLVINRPTDILVSRLFPDLKRLAALPDKVYFGGPVELTSVWFLFRAARPPEHAVQAFGSIYLSTNRELLLQLLGRNKPMDNLRIFIGHSGWGPGQLEAEIAQGAWQLEHADPDAIFSRKSEHPWPAPAHPDNST
jgi:putative transcriptional regulator